MEPSFVNLPSLSEIYTGKVVVCDLQVQIKIAIENSLLSKLPLRDHICVFMWKKPSCDVLKSVIYFYIIYFRKQIAYTKNSGFMTVKTKADIQKLGGVFTDEEIVDDY